LKSLTAFVLTLLVALPAMAEQTRLNFVVILVDDLGWMDVSCQGSDYYRTPHVDRLAAEGIRFTNAYAACAVCSPTRAAVQTGRYPGRVGVTDWIRALFQRGGQGTPDRNPTEYVGGKNRKVLCPPNPFWMEHEELTIAEALGAAGYKSAYIGKWHLGEHEDFHPNKRGFDYFAGFLGGNRSFWPLKNKHNGYLLRENDKIIETPEYLTDYLGKQAASFAISNKDNPFFMYLAFNAVHSPLEAKKEDLDKLSGITDQRRRVLGAMTIARDRAVGYLTEELKKQGLYENTLIVFSNDNGAATYLKTDNGGLRGRKGTVWEGGLRVPYSMSWPARFSKSVSSKQPVSTLDVAWTFCKEAGYSEEELSAKQLHGADLMKLASEEQVKRALYWKRGNTAAIRRGDWKLIRLKGEAAFLFNLKQDRLEKKNLLQEKPEMAEDLGRQLKSWEATLPAPRWKKKAAGKYHEQLLKYWK